MESDWALIEFRPGRFAKVTSDGTVIGIASEAEARAWFAARGWDGAAETAQPVPSLSLDPPPTRSGPGSHGPSSSSKLDDRAIPGRESGGQPW
jgi:hypothetical protein